MGAIKRILEHEFPDGIPPFRHGSFATVRAERALYATLRGQLRGRSARSLYAATVATIPDDPSVAPISREQLEEELAKINDSLFG